MLTQNQIREFAKKFKISDSVVLREYYRLVFLKELYSQEFRGFTSELYASFFLCMLAGAKQ